MSPLIYTNTSQLSSPKMLSSLLLLTFCGFICFAIYLFSKRKFNYWKHRNVPFLEPTAVVGNYGSYILQREYMGSVADRICSTFPDAGLVGSFYGTEPAILVKDPELIKLVLTKDFQYFHSREVMDYVDREPMGHGMFFACGDRWKMCRHNTQPFFTSAKMKKMFYLIRRYAIQFEGLLDYESEISDTLEVTSIMSRYTMDCVGSCGFGIEINTMGNDINNPYRIIGPSIFGKSTARGFKKVARAVWPAIFYGLGCTSYPTELSNFFYNLLIGVFKERGYKPTSRNDFVDMMLALKQSSAESTKEKKDWRSDLKVDDEFLVGQSMTLFSAGFETASSALSFTLYELAKDQEAQRRALEEVDEYFYSHNGMLEHDCTTKLPYLDACFREVMRLYPVVGVLTREAVGPYTFPSGVTVDRGVHVHIPLYHLHHHPDFFPDPETFQPERFLQKDNIKPYTYLPFGEGPRICIGIRFGEMQVMAGLITVLKKYKLELAEDMPREISFEPHTPTTQPKGGIRLKFIPRDNWQQRLYARFNE